MGILRRLFSRIVGKRNTYCLMYEGLFNVLGQDIIGMSTIVPLFLADLGAGLGVIGALTTIQSIASAVIPLLTGGAVAAAYSKRRVSLVINGISRSLFLLVPLALVLGLSGSGMVMLFFGVMVQFYFTQPVTGISYNYLLGDCIEPRQRGKMLGTLYSISGLITFCSSYLVKFIRQSEALSPANRYALIFLMGGLLLAASVLFFIPLRERSLGGSPPEERNAKAYLSGLIACYKNRDFFKLLRGSVFSYVSASLNAFLYVYAQNGLRLTTSQTSNMIILQTVGAVVGSFALGRISARFGTKRMLILAECFALVVPALSLMAGRLISPFPAMMAAVSLLGFARMGQIGYSTYTLEVAVPGKTIYYIITKSLTLLPFSFIGVAAGLFIDSHSFLPVFMVQIGASLLSVFFATRLRLIKHDKPGIEAA